jgi:transcription antitermination factor NusA-like protein
MNNYSDDYLDELDEAMDSFDVNDKVIKQFVRESKRNSRQVKKKINKVKIDFIEEKE